MKCKMYQTEIHNIIGEARAEMVNISDEQFQSKPQPNRWSKQEILGHLIDSAQVNYRRFQEIANGSDGYKIEPYPQDKLVSENRYQQANRVILTQQWVDANEKITSLLSVFQAEDLNRKVMVDQEERDLNFLIADYIRHMEHHLKQILEN